MYFYYKQGVLFLRIYASAHAYMKTYTHIYTHICKKCKHLFFCLLLKVLVLRRSAHQATRQGSIIDPPFLHTRS